ncbi:MAG: putative capsular polysaccharide synthesis family protein [Spirochaetota bacterium]
MLRILQSNRLNIGRWAFRLPKRVIRRLVQENYYTARAYYHHQLHRLDNQYKYPPLLVHQMGKVGSSSVTQSLKAAKIDRHIYHTHFLTSELINRYEQQRKGYLGTPREGDLRHIWQYQHLRKLIERGLNGEKWKIVTLVRDPVARNLSDFFEHIEVMFSAGNQQKLKSIEYDYEIIIADNNFDELIELFFERHNQDVPMEFFDRELKGVFNIDVFSSDFPTDRGYKVYREKEVDVLLIKVENLNDCFTEAIKELLNIDGVSLVSVNVGGEKEYANIYQMVKESIRFPESYLDRMYSSEFARHFYSEAEIERFKLKWQSVGEKL